MFGDSICFGDSIRLWDFGGSVGLWDFVRFQDSVILENSVRGSIGLGRLCV